MDSARWEQIQSLFHEAVALPAAEQRAFLETATGGDAGLMAEIDAMIQGDAQGASLLDEGLPEVAHQILGMSTEPGSLREFGPYRLKEILGEGHTPGFPRRAASVLPKKSRLSPSLSILILRASMTRAPWPTERRGSLWSMSEASVSQTTAARRN
jgi:hypothetical protein